MVFVFAVAAHLRPLFVAPPLLQVGRSIQKVKTAVGAVVAVVAAEVVSAEIVLWVGLLAFGFPDALLSTASANRETSRSEPSYGNIPPRLCSLRLSFPEELLVRFCLAPVSGPASS